MLCILLFHLESALYILYDFFTDFSQIEMLSSCFGTTAYVGNGLWFNNINYFSLWDKADRLKNQ